MEITKLLVLLLLLPCSSCSNKPVFTSKAVAPKALVAIPKKPVIPPPPAQKKLPLKYYNTSRNGVSLSLVSFDDRDYVLEVADQPNGLGSSWETAESAAKSEGGVAAINGGFFTPEGKPLGLLFSHGKKRGFINHSYLGTGIYFSNQNKSKIVRKNNYLKHPPHKIEHLLQSGPMLAEKKHPVTDLSNSSSRPRSFIAWDGKHHWAMGHAKSCTLKELSNALAGNYLAGFTIQTALNLDGGRSSDLWIGASVPNGSQSHRGFFNKTVRNYLILKKR